MSGHHHLPDPLPHSPDGLSSGAERFVAFLRVSGWEVALLDDLLRPLFATSRAARILGLKGGSAEMDDPPREAILACFQGGEDGNLLHSGPEGEIVRLSFTRTMLDGSPHLLIAVGAGEDVSFQRTADKLRHKEARLGAALDLAKLGMYEWDLKTNEVILDARSREIFGFGPEEPIRAQDVFARIDPADFPRVHRAALDSIEKKERLRTEYRLLLPGDKRRLVISLSDVELGPDQTPVRVVGLFGDVTARRAAENALRESEDRQAFLLQLTDRLRNLSDPIAIQDEAVRHLAEHLRVDRGVYGEVETDDDDGVVVHRDYCRPGVRSAAGRYRFADFGSKIAESLRTGKTLWADDVDQDGDLSDAERAKYQEFSVRAYVSVPLVRGGRIVAHLGLNHRSPREWTRREIGIVEEVAERTWAAVERVRAEQALRRSEEKYRWLFNSIEAGFCILEVIFDDHRTPVDFRYLEVNPAFVRQTGLDGAAGRTIRELVPDIEEVWIRKYGEVVRTGRPIRHVDRSDALGRWFEIYAFRLGDGVVDSRVAVLFSDISERQKVEQALLKAQEDLRLHAAQLEQKVTARTAELGEQALRLRHLAAELASAEQRERKRLAALLHDNLQQLLVAASMHLSVAGRRSSDPAGREAIEQSARWIAEATEAARDLTHQLRPPALYEDGLSAALHGLALDMRERHQIEVEIDSEGEPARLDDDLKAFLFDAIRELLFNVAKHAGVKGASVHLSQAGHSFRILVEDAGKGMEAGGEAGRAEGRSFGLFSIRERLFAMGGRMTIASGEGLGTRILLEVPLMENDLDQNPVPVKISDEPAAERGQDGAIRVLVADDHAIVRQGLTNLLEEDPRFVVVGEAGDGEEAVRAVEKDRPDVLLLDVNMPRMNGIEVAREVSRRWPDVIVVGLSVQDDETTARAMIEAGASAFLSKAGESERMFATLTDLMAQRAGGADN